MLRGLNDWLRFAADEMTVDVDIAVPRRVGVDADVQFDAPALARTRRVQLGWQQPLTLGSQNMQYEARITWAGVHDPASADVPQVRQSPRSSR